MVTQIYDGPPRFFKGHGVQVGLFGLAFVDIWIMRWMMKRHNAKKEATAAEWAGRGGNNPDENKTLEDLCDDYPSYRYIYWMIGGGERWEGLCKRQQSKEILAGS